MVLVGLVFSTVGPMLVPFSALYFAIGRVVWTHQLTQVYAAGVGNDGRGMLWMHMMDKVFVSLLVFQIILIGIFLLKGAKPSVGLDPFLTFVAARAPRAGC